MDKIVVKIPPIKKITAEVHDVTLNTGGGYDEGYAAGAAAQYVSEIKDGVFVARTRTYAEVKDNVLYLKKENNA